MTATNPLPDRYADAWARHLDETNEHTVTVLHEDGDYLHLRYARPGTGIWAVEVLIWPGQVAITGDLGSWILTHPDPVALLGRDRISIDYVAEKVTAAADRVGLTRYSAAKLSAELDASIEANDPDGTPERRLTIREDMDWILASDTLAEAHENLALYAGEWDWALTDWTEWDLTDYSAQFLGAVLAARDAIRNALPDER